jgi:hypothetical protein
MAGVQFLAGAEIFFLFPTTSRPALGLGSLSLEEKQLGHEADHSSPSSTEVKNAWSYTSTSIYVFTMCLIKHRICLHGVVLC